jgi:acyl carrier protein
MFSQARSFLPLSDIETRVCDIIAEQLGLKRRDVHPQLRLIQDLNLDSLELVELVMTLEDAFGVDLPNPSTNSPYKIVFTRSEFRLRDIAELVYLQQSLGRGERRTWRQTIPAIPASTNNVFTQLGGRFTELNPGPLYEPVVNENAVRLFRRQTDGMMCAQIPAARVVIGNSDDSAETDEAPAHAVQLKSFLIDVEPVSTTAYARFLNSIKSPDIATLRDWFILDPQDKRQQHLLLRNEGNLWRPITGTERLPMMLISWYGANAYSLWANRHDWRQYRADSSAPSISFLPTEAQWEYAARGAEPRSYPWGNDEPTASRMQYARHVRGATYTIESLPMAAVNEDLGQSPFGLRHMAGNVWQWCRDWYAPDFYKSPFASLADPFNHVPSGIRSERGGSWIGPAILCRSSYRRGRAPFARGRCLGFRCVGDLKVAQGT